MAARRRRGRLRALVVIGIFLLALVAAFIWLTWQNSVRISTVTISNQSPALAAAVSNVLAGTYLGIVPKNSYFFVPEHEIREALFKTDTGIQAISISHAGLTGLTISLNERVPIARWCGLAKTEGVAEYCYVFDATGYIFAASDTSSSTPLNSFAVYDAPAVETGEPIGETLSHAAQYPNLFDFARKVQMFGSSVESITLHGDEADIALASGTRITYVLGTEEAAYADLMSSKNNLSLTDGSIDYVDLRFAGKVYVKRR